MANIKDNTAAIPFALFVILAAIVAYSIIKGSPKRLTQAERDAIYNKV